jgi:hypothetical protein
MPGQGLIKMIPIKTEFDGISLPSTFERLEALWISIRDAQVKARNELRMMHWDEDSSTIHLDHASSTGLYRMQVFI